MEEVKDVVLNVYSLSTDSPELGRTGSFFSRMLPSMGMGAYHTSLAIGDGYNYTFAAGSGIVKLSTRHQGVPPHATFQESISLGLCRLRRGEINEIIKKLQPFFGPTSYHLVHRNCNHFTETLATALILHDELIEGGNNNMKRLETYPVWVNRLASTSGMVVTHDDDISPCSVLEEAAKAVGADEKVGWSLSSSSSKKKKTGKKASSKSSPQTKKTLTEAQKAALAKIRKK